MGENKKIYIQDLDTDSRGYKQLLENFACTDCGLVPHYELGQITNGGFDIKFMVDDWGRVNDESKCPLCYRKHKIKRIINNNSI